MMGDSLPHASFGQQIRFKVEVKDAFRTDPPRNAAVLTFIKNGSILAAERFNDSGLVREFVDRPHTGDYYRAELRFLNLNPKKTLAEQITGRGVVALTNPIYTEAR